MNYKQIRNFYWLTFILSVFVLLLNIGLVLVILGIFIVTLLILHIKVGLNLTSIKNNNLLILISACNFFAFALVRPDGVHTTVDTGLSALLAIVNMNGGYNSKYEAHYFIISLILLIVQLTVDIRLLKKRTDTKQHIS